MNVRRVLITVLAVGGLVGLAQGGLHLDLDTGLWIQDGFDISIYADLRPLSQSPSRFVFGPGGSWGTDMYACTIWPGWPPVTNHIYRIGSDGQATLVADTPSRITSLAFPNPGSGFGDYLYMAAGSSYYAGNKTIYRMDPAGTIEIFVDGSTFQNPTTGAIHFAPPASPYGNYMFAHDHGIDEILRIDTDGNATTFSTEGTDIVDFTFDTYGLFGNQLLACNRGDKINGVDKIAPDGTGTVLLGNEFYMGGGCLTPPESPFAGKFFLTETDWTRLPTDLYVVSPDGSYELFASGFDFDQTEDVVYGPDAALYVDGGKVIYRITPEPAALSLLAVGCLALVRKRHAFS